MVVTVKFRRFRVLFDLEPLQVRRTGQNRKLKWPLRRVEPQIDLIPVLTAI